ncbi:MAG: glycosyltransferase, partial [bacterium]
PHPPSMNPDEVAYHEISDPAVMNKCPLVSVKMITYNHEPYIAQAIEGVLMQETDFPIELVIGEDCSTDRTREIVLEYQRRRPDVIRVVLWDKNVGAGRNSQELDELLRGEFIAFNEGDDYWVHPKKLQRQVSLLEKHPDCALCFSDGIIASEFDQSRVVERMPLPEHNRAKFLDLLQGIPLTCTLVYRRVVVDSRPDWFPSVKLGTHGALVRFSSQFGDAIRVPEPMAVYRKHAGGAWSGCDAIARMEAARHKQSISQVHFGREYWKHFERGKAKLDLDLSLAYKRIGRRACAAHLLLRAAYSYPPILLSKQFLSVLLRMYCGSLYGVARSLSRSARTLRK